MFLNIFRKPGYADIAQQYPSPVWANKCNRWLREGIGRIPIDRKEFHNLFGFGEYLKANPRTLQYNLQYLREKKECSFTVKTIKVTKGDITGSVLLIYDREFVKELAPMVEKIFLDGTFEIVPSGLHTYQFVTILFEIFQKVYLLYFSF